MKPLGRPAVALFGLTGMIALGLCMPAAGFANEIKDAIKSDVELSTAGIGEGELPIGDLIADAIRAATGADAAFIASSSFSSNVKIPRGNITPAEVLKALEYKVDKIVIVNVRGGKITDALNNSLALFPGDNSGFLQFSGLTVTMRPDGGKNKVASVQAGGAALDANRIYRVAMPAPLANGALAYFQFWTKDDIDRASEKRLADATLETAVNAYLRDRKTLTRGEDRLIKNR